LQPKLDGVRCIFTKDGVYSRAGNEFKNVAHIKYDLTDFFRKHPNAVLDGELYNHALKDNFEKIISLVRKQKPTLVDRHEAKLLTQFHCYDMICPDFDHNFSIRDEFLQQTLDNVDYVKLVDTKLIESEREAKDIHFENLALGYEGSIIRLNTKYQQKRSHSLRKFKDFSDKEATIIGYLDGKGKRTGTLGKFIMQDDEGIEFGCPPGKGYTYKDLKVMLDNIGDYIGKRATFTYFERTKANSYRHPLFKCIRNYE
jgi:ATP-dependent DNA ligase